MHHLQSTLGNENWLRSNEDAIKKLLPDTWTLAQNLQQTDGLRIGFGLKCLGVEWRSADEFGKVMVFLEKIGLMQRQNGFQVRANPSKVFR